MISRNVEARAKPLNHQPWKHFPASKRRLPYIDLMLA